MKKLIALLLALAMTLCFAACGGEEKNDKDASPNASPTGKAPETVKGETYDAGNVSALTPEGWLAVPTADMWSDEEGATDPDQFTLVKGGESEFDTLTKPSIQVVHYEPESMMVPSKDLYEGAVEVAPITAGDLTWEGFSAKDFLDNPMTILWTTNADGHQFQLNLFTETAQGKYALTDADVLAILASVTNS